MPELIILGGGAAGLAAAAALTQEGTDVILIEARDRLGGRILTEHDPACEVPLELGAEFVHGRPPQITRFADAGEIDLREVAGEDFCYREAVICKCDFFDKVDELLSRMEGVKEEQSFDHFLASCCSDCDPQVRRWARGYVEGFNAAEPGVISVQSLLREAAAEDEIDGQRAFRIVGGYDQLVKRLLAAADPSRLKLELNTVVRQVRWSRGHVEVVGARRGPDGAVASADAEAIFRAPATVVTLPAGVLQQGDVTFAPDLPRKFKALAGIVMGQAMRISLRFSERFWADSNIARELPQPLDDLRFLFTLGEWFPTWWSAAPVQAPLITGWAPASRAARLAGQCEEFIVDKALGALAASFPIARGELESLLEKAYVHDWQSDPYSRGAYSYLRVGGLEAPGDLAAPVEQTLFFAGEATENDGHHATVHGAIATGIRAAREVLAAFSKK